MLRGGPIDTFQIGSDKEKRVPIYNECPYSVIIEAIVKLRREMMTLFIGKIACLLKY